MRAGYHTRPSFLIIGAQKSGTSALHSYLSRYPGIVPASRKEIHFFDQDLAYSRGVRWYHGHFPLPHRLGRHAVTFEATPSYLYRRKVPERILSYEPQMKLVVLLRDPVQRAYSQWNMYRLMFADRSGAFDVTRRASPAVREWADQMLPRQAFHEFEQAVQEEMAIMADDTESPPDYLRRGLYYGQLLRYFGYFGRDQIFVAESKELRDDPERVLNGIIDFLGMPSYDWRSQLLTMVHVRQYEQKMTNQMESFLRQFYRPHNDQLYELLGREYAW